MATDEQPPEVTLSLDTRRSSRAVGILGVLRKARVADDNYEKLVSQGVNEHMLQQVCAYAAGIAAWLRARRVHASVDVAPSVRSV